MNIISYIYSTLVKTKEKAVVGFVVTLVLSFLGQYGITGHMTVEQALTALGTGILTALSVYFKSNSKGV